MDADKSGFIDHDELFLAVVKMFPNEEITPAAVKAMMREADSDDNGLIDYAEFVAIMEKSKTRSELWRQAQKSFLGQLQFNIRETSTTINDAMKPLRKF
jgi:Ca2+-binding EF-hand superfamily protein